MPDTIRCPNCSKNNPADAETCSFCGASLAAPANQAAGSGEPDWLRDFRSSSAPTPGAEGEADDTPDWLKEVRGGAESSELPGLGAQEPEEELPGWLSDLSAPSETPPAQPAPSLDDWLSNQPASGEPEQTPAPEQPSEIQPAGEDWMANLASWSAPERGETVPLDPSVLGEPPVPEDKFESPQLPAAEEPSFPESSAGDVDLDAWLKSLGAADEPHAATPAASASPSIESQPAAPDEAIPDWLSKTVPPSPEPAPAEEAPLPGWLSGTLPPSPEPAPAEETPLPNWLSAAPAPPQEPAPAETPAEESAVPGWLSSFGAAEPARPETPAEQPPATGEPVPDWLAGFAQEPSAPSEELPAAAEQELPPWMSAAAAPPEPQPSVPAEPETPAGEIPDFAALLAEEAPAAQPVDIHFGGEETPPPIEPAAPPAPVAEAAAPQAEPPAPSAQPEEAPVPDWLASFAGPAEEPAPALPPAAAALPFIDEQLPAWLNNIQPPAGTPPAAPSTPALTDEPLVPQPPIETGAPFQVDLPEWLGEGSGPEKEVNAAQAAGPEELAPAEIPGWVQEMRPLETVIPGEEVVAATAADQQRVEKAGPLAGMRGVLPAEDLATRFRKLPAYSARLRVSERQRSHAALLQNVLDAETQPFSVPAEPSAAPQYIYRFIIAVVLILALVFGLLSKDTSLFAPPVPTASDASLLAFYNQVETLPAGAPVLLAVDYEPALAGELKLASSAVINHLMTRGAALTLVSTVPSGPVLGDDLLASALPGQRAYSLAAQTANLGYLPGGATSLLQFGLRPREAAPLDYQGRPVWDKSFLKGVNTVHDFALIVVLTDSAETGRAWVEQMAQVQGSLGETPMLMVSSAQAGPLLMPYVSSGQLKGLVSGFLGGAMYEQRAGNLGVAGQHWNSYQIGYVAGILLLILGGVISALLGVARLPRKGKA